MNKIKHRGLWLTIVLSVMLLVGFYGKVLFAPGQYMFNTAGDGVKNYFSFAWHVEHDTSWTTFSGMNYPFGEQIDYPDAQPLQSNVWRALCKVFPQLFPYTIAVINLLMLLSLVLCPVFMYLILREFSMPDILAALFAVLISYMAPQVLRGTQAHYALAYAWAVPSAIWVMLRQWRSLKPGKWALAMFIMLVAWLFTHVYLGFISSVLVLLCGFFALLFKQGSRRSSVTMMAAPVLALAAFMALQKLTDTHIGRTLHPTGFFIYQMTFSTLLAPDQLFASPLWSKVIGLPDFRRAEGWSYIGLGTMLMVLVVVALLVRASLRGRARAFIWEFFPPRVAILLASSILLLAFAFGLPFDPWCKECLWNTPLLGQFRAPGRFGWAFYFAITVWAAFVAGVLWKKAEHRGQRISLAVLIALVAGLFFNDLYYMNKYVGEEITRQPNLFDMARLPEDLRAITLAAKKVRAKAMVTLPYYHNGGEELMIPADEPGLLAGQVVAQLSGIPLMNSSLTRTGLGEVRELIQGMGPDWYPKPISKRFHPNDTILVILSGSPLGAYDRSTAAHSDTVMSSGPYTLLATTAGRLFANRADERVKEFQAMQDRLYPSAGWYFNGPDTFLLSDGFENRAASYVHSGKGAYSGAKKEFNVIATLPASAMDTGITYLASLWYYNQGPMRCHAMVGIDDHDPVINSGVWAYYTDPRFSRTIVGDWSLVELPFRIGGKNHEVKLFITGQPYDRDSIWVDDLNVRVAAVDVYRPDSTNGTMWFNGHTITP